MPTSSRHEKKTDPKREAVEKEVAPICSKCGNNRNMIKHADGSWVCHKTHLL